MSQFDKEQVNALAEAWASIDGKLEVYRHERDNNIGLTDPGCTGTYEGYEVEAREMLNRLFTRGFILVPRG